MGDRSARPDNHADAGGYVYADRDDLDGVIGDWKDERDDIRGSGDLLAQAYYSVQAPASDMITQSYFDALRGVFSGLHSYNTDMSKYTDEYLLKLVASREELTAAEDENAARFSREGGIQ